MPTFKYNLFPLFNFFHVSHIEKVLRALQVIFHGVTESEIFVHLSCFISATGFVRPKIRAFVPRRKNRATQ